MNTTVSKAIKLVQGKVKVLFSNKFLLYTNTAISVCMSCVGDGLQQKYQIAQKEAPAWDKRRSRDVGITGFLIGPFCHYWYIFLDKWLPGRTAKVVAKKLIVDQVVCSPIAISSFLVVTCYLEGKRGSVMKNELIDKGKTLYMAEWLIWPPAQIVNFAFLPTKYRVLFDNTVSFGFDWYFSYVKYGVCNKEYSEDLETEQQVQHVSWSDDSKIASRASHMPFLHIQAADIVQLKQENFHILSEKWQKRYCHSSESDDDHYFHILENANISFSDFIFFMYILQEKNTKSSKTTNDTDNEKDL